MRLKKVHMLEQLISNSWKQPSDLRVCWDLPEWAIEVQRKYEMGAPNEKFRISVICQMTYYGSVPTQEQIEKLGSYTEKVKRKIQKLTGLEYTASIESDGTIIRLAPVYP
jgi:hypothetical protein